MADPVGAERQQRFQLGVARRRRDLREVQCQPQTG